MFTTPLRRLLLGAAVVAAVACGGDSATGTISVAGTYSLQTVNGKVLPYVLLDTLEDGFAIRIDLVSPTTLVLGTATDFKLILTTRANFGGSIDMAADTIAGTYTRAGTSLLLSSPGQPPLSGTWDSANRVTLSGEGDVLVFTRP